MKPPAVTRKDIDEVIVNVELTLASIVQGLAPVVPRGEARARCVSKGKWYAWPYDLVALLIILLFWSRALIHTLTLIRWPLEFVHNFFYFGCALVEVLALHAPRPAVHVVTARCAIARQHVWALFIDDLRLIRMRAIG